MLRECWRHLTGKQVRVKNMEVRISERGALHKSAGRLFFVEKC